MAHPKPKPPKRLVLSFAGKRLLSAEEKERVKNALDTFFQALKRAMPETAITMLNGMAEGADQLAVDAFLHVYPEGTVQALLPFSKENFARTIEDEPAKKWFKNKIDSFQVIELDNPFEPGNDKRNNQGFQNQSYHLLQRGDFLLAVANLHDVQKPGGTLETIEHFKKALKPALVFDFFSNDWGQGDLKSPVPDLGVFQKPSFQKAIRYRRELEDLALGKQEKSTRFQELRKEIYLQFDMVMRYGFSKAYSVEIPEARRKARAAQNTSVEDLTPIQRQYKQFNELAIHYANLYRGGYLLNYLGFIAAILVAGLALSLLALASESFKETGWFQVIMIVLGLIKLYIITTIIQNTEDIRHDNLNNKHIDFRFVAERLRIDEGILDMGIYQKPEPSIGRHLSSVLDGYNGQMLYHLAWDQIRGAMVESTQTSILLQDQIDFHQRLTQRHQKAENKLEQWSETLNKVVKWMVVADILLAIVYFGMDYRWPDSHVTHVLHSLHQVATPALIFLAILFPALVAALYGIRSQSEFHRLAERSRKIPHQLDAYRQKIDDADSEAEKKKHFSDAAQMLLDEVAEWTLIYEKKTPEL